jgi:DNA-binding phage protein
MRAYRGPKATTSRSSAHPLVRELYTIMERERIGPDDLALKAGVSRSVIFKWGRYNNPYLPNFIAVLNAIGYDLKITRKKES